MSDLIRVVDLEVFARIGVPDDERRDPQRLLVSLEMTVDSFSHAAATDNILRTVDYFKVAQRVKNFAADKPRRLVETLAEDLANDLLHMFPMQKLSLEIKKFILSDAQYVSVKIERTPTAR
jgi:dihydroneopterin aldolase